MKCSSLHVRHESPFKQLTHSTLHSTHVLSCRSYPVAQLAQPPPVMKTLQIPASSELFMHTFCDRNTP